MASPGTATTTSSRLPTLGRELPPGCGFPLPVVCLAWALCLLVLVPLSISQRYPGR